MSEHNVDHAELAHFAALASRWWDEGGEFRSLHQLNPMRLEFIQRHATLKNARVVDVGCGGGILSESLAFAGARTTGIDLADPLLEVARLHGIESGIQVEYRSITAEAYATENPGSCDLVTCMEMLEHVPDPASVVGACAALLKTNGVACFSTLNRTPRAWLLAIVGGEYLTHLIPRGTHDYTRFIRPSELDTWARAAGLELIETAGLRYEPWCKQACLVESVAVNYLAAYRKIDS
jgi:2-polyprenyl-6-hydroxyphenyl methylase/3-demethylubiquinone-9 3-methyltransferase